MIMYMDLFLSYVCLYISFYSMRLLLRSLYLTHDSTFLERCPLFQSESVAVTVQNKLTMAENSKAQLERDNLALYAKIRYLQSITDNSSTHGKVRLQFTRTQH